MKDELNKMTKELNSQSAKLGFRFDINITCLYCGTQFVDIESHDRYVTVMAHVISCKLAKNIAEGLKQNGK